MRLTSSSHPLAFALSCLLFILQACARHVEPIQFCKRSPSGDGARISDVDFCMAVQPFQNSSSTCTDVYITIRRTQVYSSTSAVNGGWLGIGLGPVMKGALMIMLHADPEDPGSKLRTSIRKGIGHRHPVELAPEDSVEGSRGSANLVDVRVVKSVYEDGDDSASSDGNMDSTVRRTAQAEIVIYAADRWLETAIDPSFASQPWIWAHNPNDHTLLKQHSLEKNSGYGFFWTDFKSSSSVLSSSSSPPPFPSIDLSIDLHQSTVTPPPTYRLGGRAIRDWMFHLHGTLASLAFLVLYPLGALLLRTSDPRAFNFHWTTQSLASVLLALGAMIGLMLSRRIELAHQILGLVVVVGAVPNQLLLGWRHHVSFLRTGKSPTWMPRSHIWLGRVLMLAGSANVVLGLWARGYGVVTLGAAALAIALEVAVMFRVLSLRRRLPVPQLRRRASHRSKSQQHLEVADGDVEDYFELATDDEDDEDPTAEEYDEEGRLKADVRWEEEKEQRKQKKKSTAADGAYQPSTSKQEDEGDVEDRNDEDAPEALKRATAARLKRLDVV